MIPSSQNEAVAFTTTHWSMVLESQGHTPAARAALEELCRTMLLNEFLKEHRRVQELEKGIATLAERVEGQTAQIRKVTARIETNKPATRVVVSNP
jgi:hypothetical protein